MTKLRQYGKVAVLMGGFSAEREISIKSGTAVLQALQAQGIDAHGVDVGRDIGRVLEQGGFDRVINIVHGRGGEDGQLQGLLTLMGIPFTGSDVMASALSMDKLRTKQLWQALALPTPPYCLMQSVSEAAEVIETLGLPLIVKPSHEGSSIGMSKVEEAEALGPAWEQAHEYDQAVIVETWIDGLEYTVAILGQQALPIIRLETPRQFYDYEAKYLSDATRYHCPCGLAEADELTFQGLALKAFEAVGAFGWGRVDFICDTDGQPYLIELNTVPGMTDHSLVPMAAKAAGLSFQNLAEKILATSFEQPTTANLS